MSDNNAVIKIIAKHTKEYNKLLSEHNVMLKVHVKTVNDYADKCMAFDEMKKLLKQWQKENGILQESLDGAQREIERLNEAQKTDRLVETDEYGYTDEEKYGPQEGEGG